MGVFIPKNWGFLWCAAKKGLWVLTGVGGIVGLPPDMSTRKGLVVRKLGVLGCALL